MDESVINGANLFFPAQIGIPQDVSNNQWLLGLVNGAPYVRPFSPLGCRSGSYFLTGRVLRVALLRCYRLLALDATEQVLRAAGNHLYLRLHLLHHLFLARLHQHVVAPVHRAFHSWFRDRPEIRHRSRLCRRVYSSSHPRRSGHDVVRLAWNSVWPENVN